jgi:fermentation-respiration switch protein FrsA (DUF1100 family)
MLSLYALQGKMIFPGASTQGTREAVVRPRPGTDLVKLPTSMGNHVFALYGPALAADGKPDPTADLRPSMIYFYGNAMCMAYAGSEFERFRRLGFNVLIVDYLGYGMSEGSASEKGCQATADAAYDYLVSTRAVSPDHIIAAGWSLGGAVAIDLASRREVAGLIAFSTFTSARDMGRTIFPIPLPSWFLIHRFNSLEKMPKIACPILLGHGRRDPLVPFAMFERLASAARAPVTRLVIDRAEHNDFYDVGGRQIDQALREFARSL